MVDLHERIRNPKGEDFAALRRPAASGPGPGMVLVHEIFGANEYMEIVAERLAVLGYTVLCPDLYHRIEPGRSFGHDEAGLERAMDFAGRLDHDRAVSDLQACLDHLQSVDRIEGGTGVLGFCMGGSLAYRLAAAGDPDLCVSYYGSDVPDLLDRLPAIDCPILFHFGTEDEYIPRENSEAVRDAAAGRDSATAHLWEGAGHAFDNLRSEAFHQPDSACAAWGVTASFLTRHLA